MLIIAIERNEFYRNFAQKTEILGNNFSEKDEEES